MLPTEFFLVDAVDLAPRLLGKFLWRDDVVLRITEVEASRPGDSACHGRFDVTARTVPVFGPGGHAYVYLCYGLHTMLNVVSVKEGVGAAVLIRSCAPVEGLDTIQKRRWQLTDKPVLLAGPPPKVTITHSMITSEILIGLARLGKHWEFLQNDPTTLSIPLVGIEISVEHEPLDENRQLCFYWFRWPRDPGRTKSGEHTSRSPWRFAIAGRPWVSFPRNTLRGQLTLLCIGNLPGLCIQFTNRSETLKSAYLGNSYMYQR